jgi:hypothetical protein
MVVFFFGDGVWHIDFWLLAIYFIRKHTGAANNPPFTPGP